MIRRPDPQSHSASSLIVMQSGVDGVVDEQSERRELQRRCVLHGGG